MTTTETQTAINAVFADRTFDARAKVVFRELLGIAVKRAAQSPNDRELNDLISRAKAIVASFNASGMK